MMLSNDIADYLTSLGLATPGVDLFVGTFPAKPDNCMMIADTGGLGGTRSHSYPNKSTTERPTFQIITRDLSYLAAYNKAMAVYNVLNRSNITLSGVFYLSIRPVQEPFSIGKDSGNLPRNQFSVNFQVERAGI